MPGSNPLAQNFESIISDEEDLEELWLDVEAFAGTLAREFKGDIRIEMKVAPIMNVDRSDGEKNGLIHRDTS